MSSGADSGSGSGSGGELAKRVFDATAAVAGLIVLSPLMGAVALAVRLSSPGPALFRQTRVGRNGADFELLKFRSMTVSAEASKGLFEPGGSPRLTRVGRFLRRTKLDELPQLWNVARGDMSLVGPRPEVRRWVEVYPERWAKVLRARPGITDPASIAYRNEEALLSRAETAEARERMYREEILPRKLDLAERYAAERTFSGDLGILFRTLAAVFLKG